MKNRVITISREFGSGGRTIGKRLQKSSKFRAMMQKLFKKWLKKLALHPIM